ncbi:MAG: phosphotransferase family protein [Acidimicrobiales bacterium]|jgi:aminoglycoside phosphotransferase (APT) family kinase protein
MSEAEGTVEPQIRDYLAEKFAASDLSLSGVERIAVGWSHETWLFDATWTQGDEPHTQGLCLRRDPGNALLRELSDLSTQFKVLQCLESTDVPAPKPFFFEDDPAILGSTFLVMDKVPGECPNPWGRQGRAYYAEAAARGTLPDSFTDTLVALHSVDWRAAGLDFLGVPQPGDDFVRSELAKWRDLIAATGQDLDPILVDLLGWLDANAPDVDRHVLVHGAYRTGNLLIDDDRVSAVLDWETQVIGDPMYDVAYVLSDLNREGTELLSNLVERDNFYRRYESGTNIEIDEDRCDYYQLLYAMRSAAFWMSASSLYENGENLDLRLARTAWSIPVVLDRAATALGY